MLISYNMNHNWTKVRGTKINKNDKNDIINLNLLNIIVKFICLNMLSEYYL